MISLMETSSVGGKKQMKKDIFPMTEKGRQKLQAELLELQSEKRTAAKERIKHARTFCDFSTDSEYEAALKELATIESRISKIQYMMQEVQIIEKSNDTCVTLGSTVTVKEIPNGEFESYTIVGVEEADPLKGVISYESPIAKSLLGKKLHDNVIVKTPSGNRKVEIVSIS